MSEGNRFATTRRLDLDRLTIRRIGVYSLQTSPFSEPESEYFRRYRLTKIADQVAIWSEIQAIVTVPPPKLISSVNKMPYFPR